MWSIGLLAYQPRVISSGAVTLTEVDAAAPADSFFVREDLVSSFEPLGDSLFRTSQVFNPAYQRRIGDYSVRIYPVQNDFQWNSLRVFFDPHYSPEKEGIFCRLPRERFDFGAANRNGAPSAPAEDCGTLKLFQQFGWFESSQPVSPGVSRVFLTYRPDSRGRCQDADFRYPVVVIFHGTDGDSGSVRHDLFDQHEIDRVFQGRVIVFILQARDLMSPEDWEHYGTQSRAFWNTTDDHSNRDMLFVRALVRSAIQQYQADPGRIFFMGHSNGAFAALSYGMALGVRGIAMSAGGWVEHPPKRFFTSLSVNCDEILREGEGRMQEPFNNWDRYDIRREENFPYFAVNDLNALFPAPRPIGDFSASCPPALYSVSDHEDPKISVYYTCALDRRARQLGYREVITQITSGVDPRHPEDGHHYLSPNFTPGAWEFFRPLPARVCE